MSIRLASIVLASVISAAAVAADWSAVPITQINLVYPGQSSLQYVLNKKQHDGGEKFRKNTRDCINCHTEELEKFSPAVLKEMEQAPIAGRRIDALVQAQMQVEQGQLKLRLQWPVAMGSASIAQPADYDTQVSVLLDDGSVRGFDRAGCWSTCHVDAREMSKADGKSVEKYLAASRVKMSMKTGGGALKSDGEIASLLSRGVYLELWQARLKRDQPVGAVSGYVLEERHETAAHWLQATAATIDGQQVVEFSRPLAGAPLRKAITEGKPYAISVSLHDQKTSGRYHLVSFPHHFIVQGEKVTLLPTQKPEDAE